MAKFQPVPNRPSTEPKQELSAITGPPAKKEKKASGAIPAKYLKLDGATTKPRPTPFEELRLYLLGPVGHGKSQFCASFPRTVIFDFENKVAALKERSDSLLVVHRKTAAEYDEVINLLIDESQAGRKWFDFICFDPMPSYVLLKRRQLTQLYFEKGLFKGLSEGMCDIARYGKDGNGWDIINQSVLGVMNRIYQEGGYGWICTAHMMPEWKKGADGEILRWVSKLNAGVSGFLYKEAEYSGQIQRNETTTYPKVTLPSGAIVESKSKPARTSRWTLNLLPEHRELPNRQHVSLGDEPIEIGAGTGSTTFATAYIDAVSKHYSTKETK